MSEPVPENLEQIPEHERRKFVKADRKLRKLSPDEANACLAHYLCSKKRSFEFKNQLAGNHMNLRSAQVWGCRFFPADQLKVLIQEHLFHPKVKFTKQQATAILSNPSSLVKAPPSRQIPGHFTPLASFFAKPYGEPTRKEMMLQVALSLDSLELDHVREMYLGIKDANQYDEEYGCRLDQSVLYEWTRDRYQLHDLPKGWVEEFIMNARIPE
jgi:hypothetical protein